MPRLPLNTPSIDRRAADGPLRRLRVLGLGTLLFTALTASAVKAQVPPPLVPDVHERSGLLMRFADTPGRLPPDPLRDNFYGTRYADRGPVKHINGVKEQGLYGLGWKASSTESVYPYFYGNPGQSSINESSRPWPRPLRFFQGVAHPFRPVGMYYQEGSYVPIYDLDPFVPGPGPYPYPFYFNWHKGG